MQNFSAALTPPAYQLKRVVNRARNALLTALFGCQHLNPTIPFADFQYCPDCGAERDFIFDLRWRSEYADLLTRYQEGNLTHADFVRDFHKRLVTAEAAYIGEWRKGGN